MEIANLDFAIGKDLSHNLSAEFELFKGLLVVLVSLLGYVEGGNFTGLLVGLHLRLISISILLLI